MKSNKLTKKIFSAIAVLAVSVTAIGGAVAVFNRDGKTQDIIENTDKKNTVVVDTALGQTRSQTGNTYYAGPNAKPAASENDGSIDHPYNIKDILAGEIETKLQAGDTLYVLPGTYKVSTPIGMSRTNSKGEFNKYIRVVNAALERDKSGYTGEATQAVIDFSEMVFASTNRGVSIDTDYVYWYGVDICGAGDNGLYIGGSYNTVEYCEFYNNRDTGLQLGRSFSDYNSIYQWPSYNLVKDCTSHNNYDNETFGENADGFAAKLTVGFGNVFDGCIAYRNSDDGWDLYAKTDSGNIGTVIMYNCVAFENGYLEYTRDECNSLFPSYNKNMSYHTGENSENDYMTRDGDGNGFKLGGSIMEGDVILYNCLSYNNRMHGVTDNSNPGYIKSTYVTSYNNSAMVDENGNIADVANVDLHSNIDVSRQFYSYNAVEHVLSVRDARAKSLDSDNYRGTVIDSLLDASTKTKVIKGDIEGDTLQNLPKDLPKVDLLVATQLFDKIPNDPEDPATLKGNGDSMVIEIKQVDGKDKGEIISLKDTRVHLTYRNPDHSINMRGVLDKTADGERIISGYLGEGVTAGSDLNLTGWNEYTHFYENDLVNGDSASADIAMVERARDALTINCSEEAVYQDFEVPVKMLNADIEWTTTDSDYVKIKDGKDDISISSSGTEFALIEIYRSRGIDRPVSITATITKGNASVTKTFNLILKKGEPSVGEIYVEDQNSTVCAINEKLIVDQFAPYKEPVVRVKNGLYPDSHKLLNEEDFVVDSTYMYQTDTNAHAIEVKQFSPSVAGVYTITHRVSLVGDDKPSNSMSYKIYVASKNANVAFGEDVLVTANRGGFNISGSPSSATGILLAISSETQLTDVTPSNIKLYDGVTSYDFRDTSISFNFENSNRDSYFVYYALANANGEVTSQIYEAKINKIDIDTTEKFITMSKGLKIGEEEPSQTIYALTCDLDFSGVNINMGSEGFKGVFNGLGHTLANLTTTGNGIIGKVSGGTIMNLKIDNMSITSNGEKVGFVSECLGGDFYNIAFTNVNIAGAASRMAVLIGHVGDTSGVGSDLTISQVSIVNDKEHKVVGSTRVAGLIGYVQAYEHLIDINNCYVVTDIEAMTKGEGGGMVASWEDRAGDTLIISQCYYSGQLKTDVAPGSSRLGGMLGYHKGGTGKLTISRCISLAKFHIQGIERDVSVKNASPILGNFSTSLNTVVSVKYCIGLMEEYNSDYDVLSFTETNLKRHSEYLTGQDYLNLDQTRWTIVTDDNPEDDRDLYKAPYAILNFLGEWE